MSSPFEIRCFSCKHFKELKKIKEEENSEDVFVFICPAYPGGIPEEIRGKKNSHLFVREDQFGEFTFEPIEDEKE